MDIIKTIVGIIGLVGMGFIASSYRQFKNGNMRLKSVGKLVIGIVCLGVVFLLVALTSDNL